MSARRSERLASESTEEREACSAGEGAQTEISGLPYTMLCMTLVIIHEMHDNTWKSKPLFSDPEFSSSELSSELSSDSLPLSSSRASRGML